MPLYHYGGNSLIDEARVVKNATGGLRAYLHAREGADPAALNAVVQKLGESGYFVLPTQQDGKDVLEVRGFKDDAHLLGRLKQNEAIEGKATTQPVKGDKVSFVEWFRQKSLIISALFYLVGDYCYINYEKVNGGIKDIKKEEKRNQLNAKIAEYNGTAETKIDLIAAPPAKQSRSVWDWLAGYGYLTGSTTSLTSMLLRGDRSLVELHDIANHVSTAALKAGMTTGEFSPLQQAQHFRDRRSKFAQKFTTYSAEMMNLSFATAGLAIAKDSYETLHRLKSEEKQYGVTGYDFKADTRHMDDKSVALKDTVLGTGTLLSGLTSSLIKEKPVDPNRPRKKGLAGVWQFLKERPLRIAGYGYLVSTVIHLWSSLQERGSIIKDNKTRAANGKAPFPKDHTGWRLGFVIMNLIAEVIMSLSSKGHGEGVKSDTSLDSTSTSLTALMIARQPLEKREELIEKMSAELAKPEILALKKEEVATLLRNQLTALEANPWATAIMQPPAVAAEHAQETPAEALERRSKPRNMENLPEPSIPGQPIDVKQKEQAFAAREHKFADWQTAATATQAQEGTLPSGVTIH